MDTAELESTIRRVLRGDDEAYGLIVEEYQDALWRAVAPLLYDRAATEDIVQEALVSAYESLSSYRPGSSFVSWLRTIARNAARNALRSRARGAARLDSYREHLLKVMDSDEDRDAIDQRCAALSRCREDLPEKSGTLVELHYERALSHSRIAEKLGTSTEAVRQSLWRIRGALRECIEKRMATT